MYAYSGVFQFSCSMVSVGGSSLKNAHNYQCYIMKSAANDNVRGWVFDTYVIVVTRLAFFTTDGNFLYTRDKTWAVGVLAIIITIHKNVANQNPL